MDGLIPIASAAQELRGVVSAFHAAAREAGRDPRELLAAGESGVTQVYLAGGQGLGLREGLRARDVDHWLGLLGETIEAADRIGVLAA